MQEDFTQRGLVVLNPFFQTLDTDLSRFTL
jgi:hypothetical protein